MTSFKFILFLSIGILLMSCSPKKDFKQEETILVEDIVSTEVASPPPNFINKFKTINEWLTEICSEPPPKIPIEIYEFSLSQSESNFTLILAGLNEYQRDKNHSEILIEFQPANPYFSLTAAEYNQLSFEEVTEKLKPILKEFTQTEIFKQSFLAKANTIQTSYNGETIWSKGNGIHGENVK